MGKGNGIMRKAFLALAVLALVVGATPALAQAEPDIVIIDIDRVVRGQPGEIFQVGSAAVEPELVGATCSGTAQTENNSSRHPNTDLIITTGSDSSVIQDFERDPGMTTTTDETLVLGETVTASVRLGADGISSASVIITLVCTPPPTTTTTPPTTTTTAPPSTTTTTQPSTTSTTGQVSPSTTQVATTTTEAPPIGGVSAGGGAEADAPAGNPALGWTIAGFVALLGALALVAWRRMTSAE
jgi:hypothetical protein